MKFLLICLNKTALNVAIELQKDKIVELLLSNENIDVNIPYI